MKRTTRATPQRWLLAALCLLASLAFTLRTARPVGAVGPWMSQRVEVDHPAAHHAPGQPPAVQGDRPEPAGHHAAHCPFCSTAAFALAPPGTPHLPSRLDATTSPQRPRAQVSRTLPGPADARAPPTRAWPLS
ncbi:hypothetical protein [Deinococcus koreensis]|uniref:hypothetical protein n=1 Tax=Deinococcus koreensis TaxID=2054903 RepID=UPI0010571667|nr:hypothetical protein [Deinococcus koreensis]